MIDLSSSTDPRIAVASRVLGEVDAVVVRQGSRLMVVGATARDILSEALVGSPPGRATADVDVAVAVPSWAAFESLTIGLTRVGRGRHRFLVSGVQVDVVPFGDVETAERRIDWGDGTRMSALGLREAYDCAERVRLPGGTEVLVPTVAGLAVLKLTAWSDRRLDTRRDAVDLQTIIGWYATGTLLDELYDLDARLLETHDFDPVTASAHRLGRHMAKVLGRDAGSVAALLDDPKLGMLVADMPASVADQGAALRALRAGLRSTDSVYALPSARLREQRPNGVAGGGSRRIGGARPTGRLARTKAATPRGAAAFDSRGPCGPAVDRASPARSHSTQWRWRESNLSAGVGTEWCEALTWGNVRDQVRDEGSDQPLALTASTGGVGLRIVAGSRHRPWRAAPRQGPAGRSCTRCAPRRSGLPGRGNGSAPRAAVLRQGPTG